MVNSSEISPTGNGAIILTNPDAPVSLANVVATTDATKIAMTWASGATNGGTPVLDYQVSWD